MSDMDRDTWNRVAPLFDAASALFGDERAAFLDRVGQTEPELRKRLTELLDADDASGGFLEESAPQHAAILLTPLDEPRGAPPDIPSYRVEDELGRGGMGVVYLATRLGADFEQKVALKVVRPDLDSDEIHRRFVRERRILAGLEHPGIARLVDGGITVAGVSYFAMEFVEGQPITQYADSHQLSASARLALFEDVCEAVDHAHQHLVVHRDLKPSNILVTAEGRPKLLDFGIARLLEPEGGDDSDAASQLTRDATRLMTPDYASPEQILGRPATTATDVYSLGVVLYELLTGRHPHADSTLTAFERALKEGPDWLPTKLRRQLGDDVASVVAMALRHDVKDRYASPSALLDDLRRARRGLPVRAHRATWRYRLGKYVRRNRVAVTAGALVALSITVGGSVSFWQARLASREASRATRVKDFMVSLFRDADPDESLGADWTAAELLERGAARVGAELADEPRIQAELTETMGSIHLGRGEFEPARSLLREALSLNHRIHGGSHLAVGSTLIDLANAETLSGNLGAADSLLARAETILQPAKAPLASLSNLYSSWGAVRRRQGEAAAAEDYQRRALSYSRRAYGPQHPSVAADLDNLGVILLERGQLDEAIQLNRESLAIRRATLGELHSDLAVALHNLAAAVERGGDSDEAIALYGEAIAMKRQLYRGSHPSLANSLRSLGMVLRGQERLEEARDLFAQALAMNRELLGNESAEVAACVNELAIIEYLRNDLPSAKELFSEALTVFEAALSPGHPKAITVASNLAKLEEITGDIGAAELAHLRILKTRREALGEGHPDVAFTLNSLGLVVRKQDRGPESVAYHRQALELYRRLFEEDQGEVVRTKRYLAAALSDLEQHDEALALYQEALGVYVATLPANHRDLADVRFGLGKLLHRMGQDDEALPLLEQAELVRRDIFGSRSLPTASVMAVHGACLTALGAFAAADSLLTHGYAVLARELGDDHVDTRRAAADLADLRRSLR